MQVQQLVQLLAVHGYQVDPLFLRFLCSLPDSEVRDIIQLIDRKAPHTLVLSFQTMADITGQWQVIIKPKVVTQGA